MPDFLIYGANGYTGALIAHEAATRGRRPILAGRNADALATLARVMGLEHRVFALGNPGAIDEGIRGVEVVLHCAGPFAHTSRPMADACLRTGTHYLDITGEAAVFESLAARSAEALASGVMLLPGAGFDVVPSDCLAAVAGGLLAGWRRPTRRRGLGPERGGLPRRPAGAVGPGGRPRHGPVHAAGAWRGADGPARGAAGRRPQRLSPRPAGRGPTAPGRLGRRGIEGPAAGHICPRAGDIAQQPPQRSLHGASRSDVSSGFHRPFDLVADKAETRIALLIE